MHQLIIGPLQEGRVDGDHRLHAFAGHAGGEGDGMLFGDADVEVALWIAFGELDQAGALAHGRRDAEQTRILRGGIAQPFAEDLGIALAGLAWCCLALVQRARGAVERGDAVIGGGRVLSGLEAVALLRDQMQQPRAGHLFHVLQRGDHGVDVVAVDRADVVEAEFLEVGAGHEHALHMLFPTAGELTQLRHLGQCVLAAFAHARVETPGQQFGEVTADGADRRADGHLVVIEDDQQVGVERAAVVERLEGHAGAERAVADDGDDMATQFIENNSKRDILTVSAF